MTVHLQVPGGAPRTLRALYDSGAEINLVNRASLEGTNIVPYSNARKPMATTIDDKQLWIHGSCQLTMDCPDSAGTVKQVGPETFWTADFYGYDLILGYPWLAEADPCIRFAEGTFAWYADGTERVFIASVQELFEDLGPGEQPYLLHPQALRGTDGRPGWPRLQPDALRRHGSLDPPRWDDHPRLVSAVLEEHMAGVIPIPGREDSPADYDGDVPQVLPEDNKPDEDELRFVPLKLHHK